jgi:quercetin dioxygenase-like cupin family protein
MATVPGSPRVLTNTIEAPGAGPGAVWKLQESGRDLDANLIALPAGGRIEPHDGPDLDVIIHVVSGSGRLETGSGGLDLGPGTLAWLPRRSRRAFAAGPGGLRYLTVHRRRLALTLGPTVGRDDPDS